MKTKLLLSAFVSTVMFFLPSDSLEAKSHVSFGVNVGAYAPALPVYYQSPVVVSRPAYVPVERTYTTVEQNSAHVGYGENRCQPNVVVHHYPVVQEEVVVYPAPRPVPFWFNNFSLNWRIR